MIFTENELFINHLSRKITFFFIWFACLFFPLTGLAERKIQGRVMNGTSNLSSGSQKVELLTLGEGMNRSAETVTSADGSFQFSLAENTQTPHWLLRVIYEGVNYNLSVSPEQDLTQPVTLMIYETAKKPEGIQVSLPLMLAQASGNALFVQQQYLLANETQPRKTLVNSDGTFLFDTPAREVISELSVSVVGLAGIPLPQNPTPRKEGGFLITYPMKPGINEIRISYRVNFANNQRELKHRLFYGSQATKVLVLPSSLQVSGEAVKSSGIDTRTQAGTYLISFVPKGAFLHVNITGDAPMVSEERGRPGDDRNDEGEAGQPQIRVVRLSNRVFENKIPLLGGFAVVFVIAILYAVRQKWQSASVAKSDRR